MVHCSTMTHAHGHTGVVADCAEMIGANSSNAALAGEPLTTVLAGEVGEATRAWIRLAQRRYSNSLRGLYMLARCRTPQDLVAARADLVCEDLELIRKGCESLSEIVSGRAGEAVRVIGANVEA
jgi:hypothetical protein